MQRLLHWLQIIICQLVGLLGTRIQLNFLKIYSYQRSQASLGSEAFAYVPQRCQTGAIECKLHIALHGCDQDINLIGPVFLLHTNYVEMAESNDMVIACVRV